MMRFITQIYWEENNRHTKNTHTILKVTQTISLNACVKCNFNSHH
jgi:hypothetical protein